MSLEPLGILTIALLQLIIPVGRVSVGCGKLITEETYLDAGISVPLTKVPFVESRSMIKGLEQRQRYADYQTETSNVLDHRFRVAKLILLRDLSILYYGVLFRRGWVCYRDV